MLMEDSMSRKKGSWLTDHANIRVPPSKKDFILVGNLQKRRGGFGKMAQQNWKNRYFVLMHTENLSYLAYFEASDFESVNFNQPPRGILNLDEDVNITKSAKPDGDIGGEMALVIEERKNEGGGQRWKLRSKTPGEIDRWEKALQSLITKRPPTSGTNAAATRAAVTSSSATGPPALTTDKVQGDAFLHSNPIPNGTPTSGRVVESRGADTDGAERLGVWDFVLALTAVDVACYVLHTREASVELFYAAIVVANVVVGSRILRRLSLGGRDGNTGVPLIHGEEVGPLRLAIKRRFPGRKDPPPALPSGDGEAFCGVPHASSTMPHYDGPRGNPSIPHHTWTNGDSSIFRLRGKGYVTDKIKVAPAEALYDMVGMDVFATEARVGNIAAEVVMDNITRDLPQVRVPGVPPILVLNVQLPSASPNLMNSAEDGPGLQCVYYYRIKESTVRAMDRLEKASEGVRLWAQYCQHMGVDDEYHGRFKCICVIENYEALGIPSFVTKYNGKPVLINKSGNWVRGPNYLENDINVHRFSFIAKKGLHALKGLFKDMILHVGFTIEGRSSEELPESLVGCATLNYPTLDRAREFDV